MKGCDYWLLRNGCAWNSRNSWFYGYTGARLEATSAGQDDWWCAVWTRQHQIKNSPSFSASRRWRPVPL